MFGASERSHRLLFCAVCCYLHLHTGIKQLKEREAAFMLALTHACIHPARLSVSLLNTALALTLQFFSNKYKNL